MPDPSLTVLMTVYNGMPYLKEAVQSVLEQSERDFSFLILDNASTDGSADYLDAVAKAHGALPRLSILHLPENIGRTAVLNKGLSLIETEITAIIDADDLAMPRRIELQRAFLREHPGIDLLGSDIVYLDRHGKSLREERFPQGHKDLCERLPLYNQFAHAACAFRTRAAKEAGGYPPSFPYAQDLALWIAMLRRGGKAASLPSRLAGIRLHPGQTTRSASLRAVRADDDHRLAMAMLAIPGVSPASRQAARLRAALALLRLGQKRQALARIASAVAEAPLLLPFNPLLWRRLVKPLCGSRLARCLRRPGGSAPWTPAGGDDPPRTTS